MTGFLNVFSMSILIFLNFQIKMMNDVMLINEIQINSCSKATSVIMRYPKLGSITNKRGICASEMKPPSMHTPVS